MLADPRPILLANARLIDPYRDLDEPGDVLIAEGVIRDVRRGIRASGVPEGTEIIDCRDRVVAPGLVDMRAFVGEPGAEHRETLASASRAAAAGGVTTIVCQPETTPVIDDPAIVDFVLRLVALTGSRYHAASVTCRNSLEVLRRAKEAGLPVTAAASINHLTLNEIDIGSYRTFFKLTPPLRAEPDRASLVAA